MNILQKLKHKLRLSEKITNPELEKEISLLKTFNDSNLNLLASVFESVADNRISNEEKVFIDKIESLRKTLLASAQEITLTDFGAGSPDANLTAEQMYEGRTVTKTIGEICRNNSKPNKWCLLLFKLIREFKPVSCIELGTAVGISASYQSAALELNGKGTLSTLEGAEPLAKLVKSNFEELNLKADIVTGRFQDTLKSVLTDKAPVDCIFIDGHHDENATINYFETIIPYLAENALVIFDDISWSDGMQRAWKAIQHNQNLKVCVDLKTIGICIYGKSIVSETKKFKVNL